jgi:hypothetical protein
MQYFPRSWLCVAAAHFTRIIRFIFASSKSGDGDGDGRGPQPSSPASSSSASTSAAINRPSSPIPPPFSLPASARLESNPSNNTHHRTHLRHAAAAGDHEPRTRAASLSHQASKNDSFLSLGSQLPKRAREFSRLASPR